MSQPKRAVEVELAHLTALYKRTVDARDYVRVHTTPFERACYYLLREVAGWIEEEMVRARGELTPKTRPKAAAKPRTPAKAKAAVNS